MGNPDNSSHLRDRLLLAGVASLGLGISAYLAAYQLGVVTAPWDPLFGSASGARVLHSFVSRLLPIPDAALGCAAYAAEIALDLAGGRDRWRTHAWLVVAFVAVALALGLAGAALTVIQIVVVRSGCTLCLCSAAASITVAIGAVLGDEARSAVSVIAPRVAEWRRS